MFLKLKDLQQDPPFVWRIDVNAICPKCGQVALLGDLADGGSIVRCNACGFSKAFGDTAEAVVAHLIKTASIMP
jgi:hypothetical protein